MANLNTRRNSFVKCVISRYPAGFEQRICFMVIKNSRNILFVCCHIFGAHAILTNGINSDFELSTYLVAAVRYALGH